MSAEDYGETLRRNLEDFAEKSLFYKEMEVRALGVKLGEIEESSLFGFTDDMLTPELYRYQQSGVSR